MPKILYEANGYDQPEEVSVAGVMMDNIILRAHVIAPARISLRRQPKGISVCFDDQEAGVLPLEVGEQVIRKMVLFSENPDFQLRSPGNCELRYMLDQQLFLWKRNLRPDGLELTAMQAAVVKGQSADSATLL